MPLSLWPAIKTNTPPFWKKLIVELRVQNVALLDAQASTAAKAGQTPQKFDPPGNVENDLRHFKQVLLMRLLL